ncbi:hypothetical protein AB4Y30_17385 [Ornithinibacillus sp. 4-3]|uniref:DUF4367 domain-containing protein n=1 Tax=Ornithinibacillus sp. 4-3 TaxID=3231488 RepID=A0AB39HSK1_9BACI
MARHDNIDQLLSDLNHQMHWKEERQVENRKKLAINLSEIKQSAPRKRKSLKFLPVLASILLLGIFTSLLLHIMNGNNEVGEGEDTEVIIPGEDTDLPEDDNREDPNETEEPEQSLADMFEQEIEVEIGIEGIPEEVTMELAVNEELRYIIYVDMERYQFVPGEGIDRIEFTGDPEGMYPEVAMEIKPASQESLEGALAEVEEEIASEGMEIDYSEEVTEPLTATRIRAVEQGNPAEPDSPVHVYYVTEAGNGQVFIIKQMYFEIGEEGHGARFHYMLETFEVVPN